VSQSRVPWVGHIIPFVQKPNGDFTTSEEEACSVLLEAKFPSSTCTLEDSYANIPHTNVQYIDDWEITSHLKRCRNRSAPGPNKALKICNKKHPGLLPWVMNNLLVWGLFRKVWKSGKVVMIRKGKYSETDIAEYRPITLLSTQRKFYERCLVEHI
jgi:hypothetical protein